MPQKSIADAVREDRLWQRHVDLAKIGATPKGGVNRQALTPEDGKGRALVASWAEARGFTTAVDAGTRSAGHVGRLADAARETGLRTVIARICNDLGGSAEIRKPVKKYRLRHAGCWAFAPVIF